MVVDVHNHSCLSPCGSLELSPSVLVHRARERGVEALALTDHNTARNTPPFEELCLRAGIVPLCGIEVTTVEELHCLCLFAESGAALEFGRLIEERLFKVPNRPESWGDQVVVDLDEHIVDEIPFWLGSATDWSLSDLCVQALAAGALVIPAHIDRPAQSLTSQLGYVPALPFSALEIRQGTGDLQTHGLPLVKGSDAHYPDDVATRTCHLDVGSPNFEGIRSALASARAIR